MFVGEYLRRTDHIGVSACFGMLKCSLLYLSTPVSYDLMNRSSMNHIIDPNPSFSN